MLEFSGMSLELCFASFSTFFDDTTKAILNECISPEEPRPSTIESGDLGKTEGTDTRDISGEKESEEATPSRKTRPPEYYIGDTDLGNRFFINIPAGIPKAPLYAKVTAQALASERFFFSKLASISEKLNTSLSLTERHISFQKRIEEPTASSSTRVEEQESPLLSERIPSEVLVMSCKLERIASLFHKTGAPIDQGLQHLATQLTLFREKHPEHEFFSTALENVIQFGLFAVDDNRQKLSRVACIGGMLAQMEYLQSHNIPCPYSRALRTFKDTFSPKDSSLIVAFTNKHKLSSIASNEKSYHERTIVQLREVREKIQTILTMYLSEYEQQLNLYKGASDTLHTDRQTRIKLHRTDKSAWSKYLIPVEEFSEGISTRAPPKILRPTTVPKEGSEWLPKNLGRIQAQTKPHKKHRECSHLTIPQTKSQEPKQAKRDHVQKTPPEEMQSSPARSLDAPSTSAMPAKRGPPFEKRQLLVGNGPELSRPYLPHVSRWFQTDSDPLQNDPTYAGKYSLEVQQRIRIQHAFGRAVHQVVVQQGKCFKNLQTGASRYTMLGQILYHDGTQERGVFTISVTRERAIDHAFFTKKKVSELVREYCEHGFFRGNEQEEVVGDTQALLLKDDGSRIRRVDEEAVVVEDPHNQVFLWAYDVQDPLKSLRPT